MAHSVSMSLPRNDNISPSGASPSLSGTHTSLHSADQDAADLPVYAIHCFNNVHDVSADWPAATRNSPSKFNSHASPNYHIFQTTTFLKIWAETYAPVIKAKLCLIEIRLKTNQPVMFLPLAIIPRGGIRLLSFTDQGVADYNAPVMFDCGITWTKAQAENVWTQIKQALPAFDFIDFENMPEKLGSLINPLFLLATQPNVADSHATSLKPDWATIEQSLMRPKNIRRNLRLLKDIGACTFSVADTDEERQDYLNFMLYEKQQRFIETAVPGFEKHPEKLQYFKLATERFHEAGVLHLSALKLNGEIIACMWGLTSGTHYYGIMIASNLQDWAKYSPGRIMHYVLIKHLKEQGYDCLDLGVGNEDWKLQNCDLTIPLMRMTASTSLRGRLYEIRQNTMASLRATAFWQALRPLKWRLLRAIKR